METQGDRIKAEREVRGWTQKELAKRVSLVYGKKVKQQSIDQLEKGKVERPLFFAELCQVLEAPVKYIRTGALEIRETDEPPQFSRDFSYRPPSDDDRPPPLQTVPLISWVQAGESELAIDLFQPGDADEWLICPVPHSDGTYALRVQGDSMTAPSGKSFPEGIDIFVDPEQRGGPGSGDLVIAKINGRDAVTFKQIAVEDGRMYLKPLNPKWDPIFEEFRVLGKVICAGFKP